MKMRLFCLGLLTVVSQFFATGCHPVARWRANHPCGVGCGTGCGPGPCTSCSAPVHSRHMHMSPSVMSPSISMGSVGGPVMSPPCHGCGGGPPVAYNVRGDLVPVTSPATGYPSIPITPPGYPSISPPMPITPGPTVIPMHELPSPMPGAKNGNP
jgi:hypothetical protein